MRRIKATISYDGANFSGYQIQPDERTVQQALQKALLKIHKGKKIHVSGSGRTDAGVHAMGQVIHFDTPLSIPANKWADAMNASLPKDIIVFESEEVTDAFHSQFTTIGKEYRYRINLTKSIQPFLRNHALYYPYNIDFEAINQAIPHLLGEHDFTSFCSAKTDKVDKVRHLYQIKYTRTEDEIVFSFIGNGFLYNMVRILMGTLLAVGSGKLDVSQIPFILAQKDRQMAAKTAPAQALYLWQVFYEEDMLQASLARDMSLEKKMFY